MQMQVMSQQPLGKEAAEKTARSIFVGNIPYEATEEKLMELFSKAGPVVGFRLVYDRESGKPKGYGFCEYSNAAIAASALRNLQSIDFNGRPLRIGPAAGEQNSAELALSNPSVGPPLENPYGNSVDPKHAPEAISRAVASLPPEQMYELMKQMKLCIQNNPNEARNMLLQNPQLSYALLQAQIIMKIVDPKVAIAMLNRSHDQIPPARPDVKPNIDDAMSASGFGPQPTPHTPAISPSIPPRMTTPFGQLFPPNASRMMTNNVMQPNFSAGLMVTGAPIVSSNSALLQSSTQVSYSNQYSSISHENIHPGMYPPPMSSTIRAPGPGYPQPPHNLFENTNSPAFHGHIAPPGSNLPMQFMSIAPNIARLVPADQLSAVAAEAAASIGSGNVLGSLGEQEKISLIMQVLQLPEESIARLPEDQQRSILILKEQVRKTGVI